jgi:hypothetical protein
MSVAAPVLVAASWTAVLYMSATASLCKRQPTIIQHQLVHHMRLMSSTPETCMHMMQYCRPQSNSNPKQRAEA